MPIALAAVSVVEAEQAQRHQRLGDARLDDDEQREQHRRAGAEDEGVRRSPAGLVAADDRVDGEHQRRGHGDGAADVERAAAWRVAASAAARRR